MSLANRSMSLVEELKSYWPHIKHHAHRILVGGGVLTILVSIVQPTTAATWVCWLILAYIFGLPFTLSKKK